MPTDEIRERFEAFARKQFLWGNDHFVKTHSGSYVSAVVSRFFAAYAAGAAEERERLDDVLVLGAETLETAAEIGLSAASLRSVANKLRDARAQGGEIRARQPEEEKP